MSTIVIFARAPQLGEVKTRLAKSIGAERALALYEAFLDDTCALTQGLGARRVIAVAGDVDHPRVAHLAKSQRLAVEPQGDGDLGARMARAVAAHVARGPVVLIGSDAPTLPRAHVHQALDALMTHDVVLGPSDDGGYYLIGARVDAPELFADVHWSTSDVLATTLARLGERSHVLLPAWHDVDSAEDLLRLERELASLPPSVAPATRRVLGSAP
ncbi:MAG TPA: TIGR04282 family arsenosugar biosynthesis glycosyltransferase [Polyangia bacterium]